MLSWWTTVDYQAGAAAYVCTTHYEGAGVKVAQSKEEVREARPLVNAGSGLDGSADTRREGERFCSSEPPC
jgi:hypothetical protein